MRVREPLTVAFAERVMEVPLLMERIVVPVGMPVPVMVSPTASPVVLPIPVTDADPIVNVPTMTKGGSIGRSKVTLKLIGLPGGLPGVS